MKSHQFNFRLDPALVKSIDRYIKRSHGIYRNRNHFIELAMMEKINREAPGLKDTRKPAQHTGENI